MTSKYYPTTAIFMLSLFINASALAAAPYQFEVAGAFAKANTEFDETFFSSGGEVEVDVVSGGITYFLRAVDTPNGPLAERAFLDKAAYITGTYSQAETDLDTEADTIGLDARFVTATDLIFKLAYQTTDDGSQTDDTTTSVGFGKYLDGQTSAVLSYSTSDDGSDDNLNIVSGTFKKLASNESTSTATSVVFNLNYIDTGSASGFGIGAGGTYFLSDAMGIGVIFDIEKIKSSELTTFGVIGSYFLTESIFANALYTQSEFSDIKITTATIGIGARF